MSLESTPGIRMFDRLPVLFRSAMYALRGGFLIRPLAIAMVLGAAGAVLSSLEEAIPGISGWIPNTLFPSHEDPGVAQVILSSIATSIMTVVSIVFDCSRFSIIPPIGSARAATNDELKEQVRQTVAVHRGR